MRRALIVGLGTAGALALLLALASPSLAAPSRQSAQGARIFVIGDSLGVGIVPKLSARAARDGAVLEGNPKGGTAIFQWARSPRLQQLEAFRPTLVLVSLGTNDAGMSDAQIDREKSDLDLLLARLRATGARVVWLGPPRVRMKAIDKVRAMIRATGVDYLPSETYEIELQPWDQIHPTARGYEVWATHAWAWLFGPA